MQRQYWHPQQKNGPLRYHSETTRENKSVRLGARRPWPTWPRLCFGAQPATRALSYLNGGKRNTALALNCFQEPRLVIVTAMRNCNLKPVLRGPILAGASPSCLQRSSVSPHSNMNAVSIVPIITPTVGSCSIRVAVWKQRIQCP